MKTAHRIQSQAKRHWHASPTAWIETLAANSDQCPAHATEVVVLVRTAFEVLKSGHGEPADFDRLASAFNVGLVRSELIDPLAEQTMQAGIEALRERDRIQQKHGRYGFTGPGLVAVADAIELYEGILRLSKPIQMQRALEEAARRMLEQARGVEA
jgi:hypothetical protein